MGPRWIKDQSKITGRFIHRKMTMIFLQRWITNRHKMRIRMMLGLKDLLRRRLKVRYLRWSRGLAREVEQEVMPAIFNRRWNKIPRIIILWDKIQIKDRINNSRGLHRRTRDTHNLKERLISSRSLGERVMSRNRQTQKLNRGVLTHRLAVGLPSLDSSIHFKMRAFRILWTIPGYLFHSFIRELGLQIKEMTKASKTIL